MERFSHRGCKLVGGRLWGESSCEPNCQDSGWNGTAWARVLPQNRGTLPPRWPLGGRFGQGNAITGGSTRPREAPS